MKGYQGETLLTDLTGTPFENYTASDWAVYYLGSYGCIDGSHHKQWVIDRGIRILKGTPVNIYLARWENGHTEYRPRLGEPSEGYQDFLDEFKGDDGFEWDEGIAP